MAEKQTSREKLLATAADLFYREGFRSTGVDTISAASGVGKMTLYRHFPSKDDLIVAYLNQANAQFWAWFEKSISEAETTRQKILAFFDALAELASKPTCHGCPFLNAAVDFPEASHPGHAIALAHKNAVRQRFRELGAVGDKEHFKYNKQTTQSKNSKTRDTQSHYRTSAKGYVQCLA